jgi:hypothetical protein
MAGAPPHPGGSPVTAPGAGAGNEAAATAAIKSTMAVFYQSLSAFPVGSKKNSAVLAALQALKPVFSGVEQKNIVPAAVQQLANSANRGGPIAGAPAPGLANGPPPGGEEEPKLAA